MVDYTENSFNLISNAEMTATISGTIALESAIIGKQSLIFGNAWFNDCPNVTKWSMDLNYKYLVDRKIADSDSIRSF